jgi:hypothetical protein
VEQARQAGELMEGVIDLNQTFGAIPDQLYLCAAAYQTDDGGLLAAQAPAAVIENDDIEAAELLSIPLEALRDEDANGSYDRLEAGKGFVITELSMADDMISIRWNCYPGRAYRVDSSTDLQSGSWIAVPGSEVVAGADQLLLEADLPISVTDGAKFFRIAMLP